MRSLSGSQPGLLGFQQNLTCFFNNFNHGLKNHESDIQSAVSANNANLVVSELIASVSHVSFLVNATVFFIEHFMPLTELVSDLSVALIGSRT